MPFYIYDDNGWWTGTEESEQPRSTTLTPPGELKEPVEGEPYANWIGKEWRLLDYIKPEVVVPVDPDPTPEDPRIWWVNEGPYKDRFGMVGIAIYASSHPLCKGMVGMISGRQYINLKDPKIRTLMQLVAANKLPEVDPTIPGSGPLTAQLISKVLDTPTTEYERYIKGLDVQTDDAKREAAKMYRDM